MNLELQLSAFFGYGKVAEDAYLGLQCHGVLWPAVTAEAPVHWPIAPPIVSGKARPSMHRSWHPRTAITSKSTGAIDVNMPKSCGAERAVAGAKQRMPAAGLQSSQTVSEHTCCAKTSLCRPMSAAVGRLCGPLGRCGTGQALQRAHVHARSKDRTLASQWYHVI